MTDKEDQREREREQLHELSKLLRTEKITSEEYFQRKAVLLGEDIPDPDPMTEDQEAQPRDLGRHTQAITSEEYFQRKAELLSEDIPDPRPPKVRATPTPPHLSRTTAETHEEQVRRQLKTIASQSHKQTELLSSIRAWMMFFGILVILSIVGWLLILTL